MREEWLETVLEAGDIDGDFIAVDAAVEELVKEWEADDEGVDSDGVKEEIDIDFDDEGVAE